MKKRHAARRHDQTAVCGAREGRDGALDLARVAHVDRADLHPDDRATTWMTPNWPIPVAMAGSRRTAARVTPGASSLSSSSHFALKLVFEQQETGGIAARPRQTIDEAGPDRIDDGQKHNRHRACRLQQRYHVEMPKPG